MFAYCNNNPLIKSDPTGYDSSAEDLDGNGIPDYLDCRWTILTATVKARQMGERASVTNNTISFDFEAEYAEYTWIAKYLGEYKASEIITQAAAAKYYLQTGAPFLLSNECMAYEYYEHVLAYQWAVEDRWLPNDIVIAWSFTRSGSYDETSVYNATKSIDIRIKDVQPGNSQALAFGYKNGIRDCYIGTIFDPWRDDR